MSFSTVASILRDPRRAVQTALDNASGLFEPPLWAAGVSIEEFTGERIGLRIRRGPLVRWLIDGTVSLGSVMAAAEFGVRSLVARHFDSRVNPWRILRAQIELHGDLINPRALHLRCVWPGVDREALYRGVNLDQSAETTLKVQIVDDRGMIVGEVTLVLVMRAKDLLLPVGPTP